MRRSLLVLLLAAPAAWAGGLNRPGSPRPIPPGIQSRGLPALRAPSRNLVGLRPILAPRLLPLPDGRIPFKKASSGAVFQVTNEAGVQILGRAAEYYLEVKRLVAKLQAMGIDLAESLDVMDDTYGDVLAKLMAIDALASSGEMDRHNTHLEQTLTWLDGVVTIGGKRTIVHTHRVYFHPAQDRNSEINEGIRRADQFFTQFLDLVEFNEQVLGLNAEKTVLVFDARGYDEIKAHLRARAARETRGRPWLKVAFLDELATLPTGKEEVRAALNGLTQRYAGDGLRKIIEGVIYSRYVGLLLELKTIEHYAERGYEILQSGRDIFDENGQYITELDTVVRSPSGQVLLVEAKSARVPLPFEEVLHDKVIRKLDTYAKNRARLEAAIGRPFDGVVFSMDVGPTDGRKAGNVRNAELKRWLEGQEAKLTRRYGFPVSFLFIYSKPEQRPPVPLAR